MYRRFALLAVIIGILIISGTSVSADDSYTYSIMHISDTQYLSETYPTLLNFTFSYLESIKSLYNISAIIITGDLVMDGDDVGQWTNYANARSKTNIPIYEVPGNHDLMAAVDNPFYNEFVGNKTGWNAVINNFTFIGIGYNEEPLSDSDISYYRSIIEAQPQQFTLIATHNYFNRDLTLSPLGESIKDNLVLKPTFVLSGHVHGYMIRSSLVNNVSYIEDLTDYQDNGDFSAGTLYTIYSTEGDVTKITIREAYIYPLHYFYPEKIVYQKTRSISAPSWQGRDVSSGTPIPTIIPTTKPSFSLKPSVSPTAYPTKSPKLYPPVSPTAYPPISPKVYPYV